MAPLSAGRASVRPFTPEGLELTTGEVIPADTFIISVGDMPDLEFLPSSIATERGFIKVNESFQTTDPKILAIGDAAKVGLLTDAIGAGRRAAQAIADMLEGKRPRGDTRRMLDPARVKVEYFDPRLVRFDGVEACASQCSSCAPAGIAASALRCAPRRPFQKRKTVRIRLVVEFRTLYRVRFCAAVCPCGIWNLVENDPLE